MDVRVRGRALDHGRSVGGGRKWRQGRPLPPPSAYPVLRARKKNGGRARLGSDLPCKLQPLAPLWARRVARNRRASLSLRQMALTCLFLQAKMHADVDFCFTSLLSGQQYNWLPIYSSRGVPNVVQYTFSERLQHVCLHIRRW
jgi:hypothetical protein